MRELSLLLVVGLLAAASRHVPARRSCREHFLAGHTESGVYPLKVHRSPDAFVVCRMPFSGSIPSTVSTVVRSALERGFRIVEARTVQWQVEDFTVLNDIVERAHCRQTIHINRTAYRPSTSPSDDQNEDGVLAHHDGEGVGASSQGVVPQEGGVMLISILGEETYLSPEQGDGTIELFGRAAGVLHIVPDNLESDHNPWIKADELICEELLLKYEGCLIDGGVQVDVSASSHAHFRFAFRTEATNQALLTAHYEDGAKRSVELVNDYFLSIGEHAPSLLVGHISDGRWHTAQIALDGTHVSIDGGEKISLPDPTSKVKSVGIKLNGLIMLTDPADEATECAELGGRIFLDRQPSHTRMFCGGGGQASCECTVLEDFYHLLPSPTCEHSDLPDYKNEFQLLRHSDLLSFLLLPDTLSSADPLRLSLTFKSDSDSGLLLFGEWRNATWGRVQVHYHGQKLTAIHCTQQDENSIEICTGCSIDRNRGYGTDSWTRVSLFAQTENELFMTVDGEICQLGEDADFDTAEMYKTVLTKGSILFVGGMFNKKVRPGIYREDFKAKFFENTREKLPSLRGCVKDVFARGARVDIISAFDKQMQTTLVRPSDENYAVKMGCGTCPTSCPLSSRCRPSSPSLDPPFVCDCADAEMYMSANSASCEPQSAPPLSMNHNSLMAYRGEFAVERKGVLSKIWMKVRLPSFPVDKNTPLVLFFSHGRRILFRFYLTDDSHLAIQVNPEDPQQFAPNATKFIDPEDDRIHLVTIERRTPLGTHPSRRFFDLYIDGERFSIPDPGMQLTAIEFALINNENRGTAGCVSDLGLSYDYDEHRTAEDLSNKIHTVNVLQAMFYELAIMPESTTEATCGVLDPLLWTRGGAKTAPLGDLIEYKPNVFLGHSGGPLSSEWLLWSIMLTVLLALMLLLCLCIYFCCLRRKKKSRRNSYDDRERMVRDSPESVNFRRPSDRDSCISDSIDRTDISMYDEPKLHRVLIDRESMISFVEPTSERLNQAQVVVRGPTPSDAPLVNIRDDSSDL